MAAFDSYPNMIITRDEEVLILTLNRPERLNAVGGGLLEEISRVFREAQRDKDARAVVVTGAGRAFCAGGDVKDMAAHRGSERVIQRAIEVRNMNQEIIDSMLALEKPALAMVNGAAAGFGATLALLCDIVIGCAEHARIGDKHVNAGLVAGDGGAVIWPFLVGPNKAKELLMSGDLIEGEELRRLGIVNHLVPHEELEPFTMALAHRLAHMAPYALRASKVTINKMLKAQAELVLDVGLAWESLAGYQYPEDSREAARAFVERRQPTFTGR